MPDLDDINTLDEAATHLKITPPQLAALARSRKIDSLKQGRSVTLPRAVIEAYILANTTSTATPNPHGLTDAALRRVRKLP